MLKSVEDITVLLEDMGLNLQSMMASAYVRPFLEEVRNWEQRLSLIGECIEVRNFWNEHRIFNGSSSCCCCTVHVPTSIQSKCSFLHA